MNKQHDPNYIPGFVDAPEWAEFVQFCKLRGWVFYNKMPHVFRDGVASVSLDRDGSDGLKWKKAEDTPNVVFLANPKQYIGKSRPWPDAMP